jgi:hypothetical protein
MGSYMASTFVAPGTVQTTAPIMASSPTTQDNLLTVSRH